MARYEVRVEGLQAYGFHGISDQERVLGHRLLLDLRCQLTGNATETDELRGTVDYSELARQSLAFLQSESQHTLERLANRLGELLLSEFPSIEEVEVWLRKPHPPMPIIAESAGVVIRLRR